MATTKTSANRGVTAAPRTREIVCARAGFAQVRDDVSVAKEAIDGPQTMRASRRLKARLTARRESAWPERTRDRLDAKREALDRRAARSRKEQSVAYLQAGGELNPGPEDWDSGVYPEVGSLLRLDLILLGGDVEPNPGPARKILRLRRVTSDDYIKRKAPRCQLDGEPLGSSMVMMAPDGVGLCAKCGTECEPCENIFVHPSRSRDDHLGEAAGAAADAIDLRPVEPQPERAESEDMSAFAPPSPPEVVTMAVPDRALTPDNCGTPGPVPEAALTTPLPDPDAAEVGTPPSPPPLPPRSGSGRFVPPPLRHITPGGHAINETVLRRALRSLKTPPRPEPVCLRGYLLQTETEKQRLLSLLECPTPLPFTKVEMFSTRRVLEYKRDQRLAANRNVKQIEQDLEVVDVQVTGRRLNNVRAWYFLIGASLFFSCIAATVVAGLFIKTRDIPSEHYSCPVLSACDFARTLTPRFIDRIFWKLHLTPPFLMLVERTPYVIPGHRRWPVEVTALAGAWVGMAAVAVYVAATHIFSRILPPELFSSLFLRFERRFSYTPHSLSGALTEYRPGADIADVEQKLLRQASLPVPDDLALQLQRGTAVAALATAPDVQLGFRGAHDHSARVVGTLAM